MNLNFSNKRITGMLTVIPSNEANFSEEMHNFDFPIEKSLKLQRIMGFNKHRIVEEGTCVSDMAVYGLEHLFSGKKIHKEEIDALIVVTQSPDYLMPSTSSVIHGKLALKQDIFCIDINQGCTGFLIGLHQAFFLLDQKEIKKVALINGDVLSRKVSKQDRNSWPLIGDALSVTIVENGEIPSQIHATIKTDGSGNQALMVPAGGMRLPSSTETAILKNEGDGNYRSQDQLRMEGASVFNFVQEKVPLMIEEILNVSAYKKEEIDYYLFHQPNKFMLEKLADKLQIPYEKMPNNIVGEFGNSSGATIPMNIVNNLKDVLISRELLICLAGFGTGLTWSSMILKIGHMNFCEQIEL